MGSQFVPAREPRGRVNGREEGGRGRGWRRRPRRALPRVPQRATTRCHALQDAATRYKTLPRATTRCHALQHAATRYNTLQRAARAPSFWCRRKANFTRKIADHVRKTETSCGADQPRNSQSSRGTKANTHEKWPFQERKLPLSLPGPGPLSGGDGKGRGGGRRRDRGGGEGEGGPEAFPRHLSAPPPSPPLGISQGRGRGRPKETAASVPAP